MYFRMSFAVFPDQEITKGISCRYRLVRWWLQRGFGWLRCVRSTCTWWWLPSSSDSMEGTLFIILQIYSRKIFNEPAEQSRWRGTQGRRPPLTLPRSNDTEATTSGYKARTQGEWIELLVIPMIHFVAFLLLILRYYETGDQLDHWINQTHRNRCHRNDHNRWTNFNTCVSSKWSKWCQYRREVFTTSLKYLIISQGYTF